MISYKQTDKGTVEATPLTARSIGSEDNRRTPPPGIATPRFYPILMTMSNGRGAAYRIEEGDKRQVVMISDSREEEEFRAWLQKPGTPGYYAIAYTNLNFHNDSTGKRAELTLAISKDFPRPSMMWRPF